MRVEVSANGRHLSPTLRAYVEARAWRAVHRWERHASWVGVQLSWHYDRFRNLRVRCQIDVLLRGGGLVTVQHTDASPYIGIDCAAVRVSQALKRRLRRAGEREPSAASTAAAAEARTPPRLAVVIRPTGGPPRVSLAQWLRTRYGIEQVQSLVLSSTSWSHLTREEPAGPSPHVDWLRQRLALAELCKPELIVVVGHPAGPAMSGLSDVEGRLEVRRLVGRLVAMGVSTEVVGAWIGERWNDDRPVVVESEAVDGALTADRRPAGEVAVLSGKFDQWLAERVWEDDGGAAVDTGARQSTNDVLKKKDRRQRHAEAFPQRARRANVDSAARSRPRVPAGNLPGLRSDLASMAAR